MTNFRFIDGRRVATGILFSLLLSLSLPAGAWADGPPLVLAAGKGFAHLYSSWGKTNTFYRYDGELRLFDTVGTSYSATVFGLSGDYGLTDALELNVDIPVGYFSLTSESRFPSRSIFMPVYFGLGATYQLSRERLKTSVSTMIKVPSGFHRGIYDDPEHPTFLSDGYLQWTSMFNVGFTYKQIWMNGGVGYNFRDEEPQDEILYRLEFGFSRVEGTGIFAGVNGVLSTADASQPARPFYAGASGPVDELERSDGGTGRFSTIDRENYFAVSAGAFVDIAKNIRLDGHYSVRLFGKNSLNLQQASLGVGYTF